MGWTVRTYQWRTPRGPRWLRWLPGRRGRYVETHDPAAAAKALAHCASPSTHGPECACVPGAWAPPWFPAGR
jgi:hypothetical protein